MPLSVLLRVVVLITISLSCRKSDCCDLSSIVCVTSVADLRILTNVADKNYLIYHSVLCFLFVTYQKLCKVMIISYKTLIIS